MSLLPYGPVGLLTIIALYLKIDLKQRYSVKCLVCERKGTPIYSTVHS